MWFFGLIVVVLIGAVAVVASGRWGAMSTAYDDRPDMTVPARQVLTSTDIESARFAVGVRGYRMDEVDTLLERVAKEVAERDRRIADLERAVAPIVEAPDGAGFTSKSPYDASEFEDTGPHQPILVGGDFPAVEPLNVEPPGSTAEIPKVGVPAAPADPAPPQADSETVAEGADDDEPETSELPRTRHEAAADEYERLQAEARAVLEAQSQPVTPRRTPATPQPAPEQQSATSPQPSHDQQPPQASAQQSADQPAAAQHWTQMPPQQSADAEHAPVEQAAPATHWTQQEQQYVVREQQPAAQQQNQQQSQHPLQQQAPASQQQSDPQQSPQQQSAPQQGDGRQGDGQQGEAEGEGWQFWPPADQEGEGAYQRPS